MSYPKKEVISFLNENFECIQIDQSAASSAEKRFMLDHRLLWTPGLVFMDYRGNEVRRGVGFRQPEEVIAESAMALAKIALLHLKPEEAVRWFELARETAPEFETAPESMYWSGIALMRTPSGNVDSLWDMWEKLRKEYPNSKWATSADCRDYAPSPRD